MKSNLNILKLNYDDKYDTLYISFANDKASYGKESQPGIVVMRDMSDDSLTGYTILHFKKKYDRDYPFEKYLPVAIDFENDVYPKVFS